MVRIVNEGSLTIYLELYIPKFDPNFYIDNTHIDLYI